MIGSKYSNNVTRKRKLDIFTPYLNAGLNHNHNSNTNTNTNLNNNNNNNNNANHNHNNNNNVNTNKNEHTNSYNGNKLRIVKPSQMYQESNPYSLHRNPSTPLAFRPDAYSISNRDTLTETSSSKSNSARSVVRLNVLKKAEKPNLSASKISENSSQIGKQPGIVMHINGLNINNQPQYYPDPQWRHIDEERKKLEEDRKTIDQEMKTIEEQKKRVEEQRRYLDEQKRHLQEGRRNVQEEKKYVQEQKVRIRQMERRHKGEIEEANRRIEKLEGMVSDLTEKVCRSDQEWEAYMRARTYS